MSGVNKFSGKGQGKIHHVVVSKEKITPLFKGKLLTTERVATSEEVDKDTKKLDDKKESVVMTPFSKKKLLTTGRVTTSEEVDKGTKKMDSKKKAVFTTPLSKKILTNDKVTTSDDVDKGTKNWMI